MSADRMTADEIRAALARAENEATIARRYYARLDGGSMATTQHEQEARLARTALALLGERDRLRGGLETIIEELMAWEGQHIPAETVLVVALFATCTLESPTCTLCGAMMTGRARDGLTEVKRVDDYVFACPQCHPWSA